MTARALPGLARRARTIRAHARHAAAIAAAIALAATAAHAQIAFFGGEILVNQTVAGAQSAPAVASSSSSTLVVWQSADQDGSGSAIYGRLFDPVGEPQGGEFRVNSTTAGDQAAPAAAAAADGSFLAVWVSPDADGFGIRGRRVSASGTPLSADFAIPLTTTGNQGTPRVAGGPGGWVVVWSGPNPISPSHTDVFFRRVAADGSFASAETRVNATTAEDQFQPAIAVAPTGAFVVAWTAANLDGSGFGVYARRFDAAGVALSGDLLVPPSTVFDQTAPGVAFEASGGFVVVWQSALQPESSVIGPQPTLFGRRYDAAGSPLDDFQVNESTDVRHELAAIAADAVGGFALAWQDTDPDDGEKDVVVKRYAAGLPATGEVPLAETTASAQILPALAADGAASHFAAWASFGVDGSSFGIAARRFGEPLAPCAADATTLCLAGGRFSARVAWRTDLATSGVGQATALTDDTGYFWFFDETNVEIVLKVLDACGGFDNFWVFAGGLTDVEATLVVTDTATGAARTYINPLKTQFQPIQDTGHFFVCNAANLSGSGPDRTRRESAADASVAADCVETTTTLCLNDNRFEVSVEWQTDQGASGVGQAVALTEDTGTFWFFSAANVEMVIKVLDGCGLNDSFWVFAGGLTDVFTSITVRDTQTGAVRVYENPQKTAFQPIQDVDAFPGCS